MTDVDARPCGPGIRGVAMAIDAAVWFAALFVAVYAVAAATGQVEATASGYDANLEGAPAALALGLWLSLCVGYHTVLEWSRGYTLGKYLVAIRVVDAAGDRPTLQASLVRNLARLVDWLPFAYLVGLVAVATSDPPRRLGDRAADTLVVRR